MFMTNAATPQWVSNHIVGIEFLQHEREVVAFNSRFPGLNDAFDDLIGKLPDPYSFSNTEFPVRASILRLNPESGRLQTLATAGNDTNGGKNSTKHAESIVIDDAIDLVGEKHLFGCVLLTTVQPCIACVGDVENTGISTVVYGVSHSDVEGKHVYVNAEYKPWRTSKKGFSTLQKPFDQDDYMRNIGIEVIGGYRREDVIRKLARTHGSWGSFFSDPDSRYS
jgi:tRNA(Arg) A34 adenosine deaminase TadA